MKYPDFEKFVSVSGLNIRQATALQQILQQDDIVNLAVEIATKQFNSQEPLPLPAIQESANLSRAWFAAAFFAFEVSRTRFLEMGFPESVWQESMTDLQIWLLNEEKNSGVIGLGPKARGWQVEIYRGAVTRHGRLECNTSYQYAFHPLFATDGSIMLQKGDNVINLHIPEDGPMDLTLCSDSIKRIADFFAVYRSDYHWCGFLCQSWLLDRQLRAALDKESNIMKFQNLGIHYVMYPNDDTIFRLFGTADPTSITTPTRLQKFAIKFLQNGGIFIEEGMFIPRREIEAANYDLNKIIKPELLSC